MPDFGIGEVAILAETGAEAEAAGATVGTVAAGDASLGASVSAGAGGAAGGAGAGAAAGGGLTLAQIQAGATIASTAIGASSLLAGKKGFSMPPPPPNAPVSTSQPQIDTAIGQARRRAAAAGGIMSNIGTSSQGLVMPATTTGKTALGA